ncbi:UDP-N-acetylmuramoyl-L-alanine--D-glutamate ligase [Granulicatella elegans]|uniref:UDP-N-acetylmuramoyl-L-alanine--D-glutamate ligase n=1 Tax=Granulicatella elegans TaxID=137732 RepID=UPI001D143A36|nr:UDP-N-acetylmuramoyl-L-alanine--D-glutamate ligase [Granulicatella elegans]UEA30868.1 UDP-N-acetylmuramoyl-L-alanine--D-glutamate ligase [Granulicatella elegans]
MLNKKVFEHKRVLVIGLAKSGVAVAKLLLHQGAMVTVNDRIPLEENPNAKSLIEEGIRVLAGSHPVDLLEEHFDFVVKNPGIPYHNCMVEAAIKKGIPVYTEVEIAYQLLEGLIIGITGSNGKTTTTTLASLMLKESFPEREVYAAGNIGIPLSQLAEQSTKEDIYVSELSSFQLMGIEQFKPKIACIVNIFSAHLDYHGTREEYIKAKLQLTKNQTKDDYLVYNADYPELMTLIEGHTKATLVPFSRKTVLEFGACVEGDAICFNGQKVMSVSTIQVPGAQNVENVLAAVAIAKLAGATNEGIQKAVQNFHGVKHRTQFVKEVNKRRFYNDSKATNIVATQTALRSFTNQSVILIAGGLDRGNGFDELVPDLTAVSGIVLYGETKEKLQEAAKVAGVPVIEVVNTLEEATRKAYDISKEDDIILLSPACASWDQFKNFEIRGDEFIQVVENL